MEDTKNKQKAPKADFSLTIGGDISLSTVSLGDLADVLRLIEACVLPIAQGGDQDQTLQVSLSHLSPGSVRLGFTASTAALVLAWNVVSLAVSRGDLTALPASSRDAVIALARKSRDRCWSMAFSRGRKLLSTITPKTEFIIESSPTLRGGTTIFGRIVRAGGKDPHIWLDLAEGGHLTCDVDEDLACRAGALLYRDIEASGEAVWNTATGSLASFRIVELEARPLGEEDPFEALRSQFGKFFDPIDPDAFVAELRG